jgi:hypothetical protein
LISLRKIVEPLRVDPAAIAVGAIYVLVWPGFGIRIGVANILQMTQAPYSANVFAYKVKRHGIGLRLSNFGSY